MIELEYAVCRQYLAASEAARKGKAGREIMRTVQRGRKSVLRAFPGVGYNIHYRP